MVSLYKAILTDHNCKANGFELAAMAINSFLNGIDNATLVKAAPRKKLLLEFDIN
jgi:hypothetical protein